ncbi:hypothetical protein JTE90_013943 [Oedothorax gibbosus]|uniref:Uncharacterized protein n=1 Tax=Oedothorax gibbosus TaxID=931172 RepID=A0AAV6UFI6_9ARAC|nr:hypothetical protein JTE90_013943 [Oedothorax gibbosus]
MDNSVNRPLLKQARPFVFGYESQLQIRLDGSRNEYVSLQQAYFSEEVIGEDLSLAVSYPWRRETERSIKLLLQREQSTLRCWETSYRENNVSLKRDIAYARPAG